MSSPDNEKNTFNVIGSAPTLGVPPRWRKHLACAKTPLLWVDDAVGDAPNADDLADQAQGNYHYNSIGQLLHDNAEQITYIYNASGLVAEVLKNGQPLVKFFYTLEQERPIGSFGEKRSGAQANHSIAKEYQHKTVNTFLPFS